MTPLPAGYTSQGRNADSPPKRRRRPYRHGQRWVEARVSTCIGILGSNDFLFQRGIGSVTDIAATLPYHETTIYRSYREILRFLQVVGAPLRQAPHLRTQGFAYSLPSWQIAGAHRRLQFLEQARLMSLAFSSRVKEMEMPTGTIKKLVSDRGFGFIAAEDGKEFFFHRSGTEGDFDSLQGGEKVSFEIEASPKGPRAKSVRPL